MPLPTAALFIDPGDATARRAAAAYASDHDLLVHDVYDDPDLEDRRDRLLAHAHAGQFGVVVVGSTLALGDDPLAALRVLSIMADLGIAVACPSASWLEGLGATATALYRWMLDAGKRRKGARLRRALAEARAGGRRVGRPPKPLPIDRAVALVATMPLAQAARELGCSESNLRRKLADHRAEDRLVAGARGAA